MNLYNTMPILNPELYAPEVAAYVRKITRPDGTLLSTKPKDDGLASYIWRMVAFQISPIGKQQCVPVCADFEIPERDYKARLAITEQLDEVVKVIVDGVPREQWHRRRPE